MNDVPQFVKCTFYLDSRVRNTIDQKALITGKGKSEIVNEALQIQLVAPVLFDKHIQDFEYVLKWLLSSAFDKNDPLEE